MFSGDFLSNERLNKGGDVGVRQCVYLLDLNLYLRMQFALRLEWLTHYSIHLVTDTTKWGGKGHPATVVIYSYNKSLQPCLWLSETVLRHSSALNTDISLLTCRNDNVNMLMFSTYNVSRVLHLILQLRLMEMSLCRFLFINQRTRHLELWPALNEMLHHRHHDDTSSGDLCQSML